MAGMVDSSARGICDPVGLGEFLIPHSQRGYSKILGKPNTGQRAAAAPLATKVCEADILGLNLRIPRPLAAG
jgi:hypothetical protein